MLRLWLVLLCAVSAIVAQQNNPQAVLAGIEVRGTHLPAASIIRLLALNVGQSVNSGLLSTASDRVLATGLVADISYSFRREPNKSDVTLVIKVWDEQPLLPASVLPAQNESTMWSCLQDADPIFLKELPNTKDALLFYVSNINKCISTTSDQKLHAVANVICDANRKPAKIEFRIEPGAAN